MMHTPSLAIRLCALVALCCWLPGADCHAIERSSSYRGALNSICADDLQRHVDFLADDDLQGRLPGTAGSRQAQEYLQASLERSGMEPAGAEGSFLQPFAGKYHNVFGFLEGSDPSLKNEVILVGAHYDHVGYGNEENSAGPIGHIHNGADDNASGTSAVLELAEALSVLPQPPKRSVLFAFWDGEEEGMLGSRHWAAHPTVPLARLSGVLNLDMVGRLRDNDLTVYGSRSGLGFRRLVSQQNDDTGLAIDFSWELEDDADHYTFFQRDLPVLFFHTGIHDQWHAPSDDADLINHRGMTRVSRLAFNVLYELTERPRPSVFRPAAGEETEQAREQYESRVPKLRERLGAQWCEMADCHSLVHVAHVSHDSPAARAGIREGDRIVEFADNRISNQEQLTSAVMLAEHRVPLVIQRPNQDEFVNLTVELDGAPMRLGITWRLDDAEPDTIILTRVVPGSPAAVAGLRRGDRVYRADGRNFADQDAFLRIVGEADDSLSLTFERQGRLNTAVLRFLEREKDAAGMIVVAE